METADKVRENRLRRMAERQGFTLRKSPRRDVRAFDYGKYLILDAQTDAVVCGSTERSRYGNLGLDDVDAFLTRDTKQGGSTR